MCATSNKRKAVGPVGSEPAAPCLAARPARRAFIASAGAAAVAGSVMAFSATAQQPVAEKKAMPAAAKGEFWPGNARLVMSISMQFEAGGQPPKGTDSPFPKVDFPASVPSDAAANTWFAWRNFTPVQFLEQIKLEFDQLYEEGATRRRMMSISAHDRISGTPQMVRVGDEFLRYAKSHAGVAFMRKDAIASYVRSSAHTLRESETI